MTPSDPLAERAASDITTRSSITGTTPSRTGSLPVAVTIGIFVVSRFAAIAGSVETGTIASG